MFDEIIIRLREALSLFPSLVRTVRKLAKAELVQRLSGLGRIGGGPIDFQSLLIIRVNDPADWRETVSRTSLESLSL